jgi:hydrogenase expression/formation protein HypC
MIVGVGNLLERLTWSILSKKEPWRMCLAIPSRIERIKDNLAIIDVDGVKRTVSLLLLEDAKVGDYVIVHAGFALHKIDEAVAMESLEILRKAASLLEEGD